MTRPTLRRLACCAVACLLSLVLLPSGALAQRSAPDFPPGPASDGARYHMSDFEGKAVVLFFYEQNCPTCRGSIPLRNKVVEQYAGKPVKFIAIAPGDTFTEAKSYVAQTKLKMPVFSDLFGVMQTRYGFAISLQNIYQVRVIDPKGNISAMTLNLEPAAIDKALATAKWKYKDDGYHPALAPAIDLLEWGQYEQGMRLLRPYAKAGNKQLAESANKLLDTVRGEARLWMEEAKTAADKEPAKAAELYAKVAFGFQGEDIGKEADAALKDLMKKKEVTDEIAARGMFDQFNAALARAQKNQKATFVNSAKAIAAKYPETPTGKQAATLAADLEKATAE
ncbi:MAG TPA: redoxin domain-containing protein [Humisphaera sp.]